MKKNLKYFLGFLLLVFSISFTSCRKKANQTIVRGTLVDTVKNKVIANQKVIVVSCYAGNFRRECGNLLTSTRTNSEGKFEISFDAPNNPLGFEIRAALDSNYYFSSSTSEEVIPLKANDFTLYAREISYLKLDLKVSNNPLNPLLISCGNSFFTLAGSSIDTVLYCKILPKSKTEIVYNVWDRTSNQNRQLIDTLNLGLKDTSAYSKQITDTRNMPIR